LVVELDQDLIVDPGPGNVFLWQERRIEDVVPFVVGMLVGDEKVEFVLDDRAAEKAAQAVVGVIGLLGLEILGP